jgi:hypothetical protein
MAPLPAAICFLAPLLGAWPLLVHGARATDPVVDAVTPGTGYRSSIFSLSGSDLINFSGEELPVDPMNSNLNHRHVAWSASRSQTPRALSLLTFPPSSSRP